MNSRFELPRAGSIQELFRLFAAGTGPHVAPSLANLAYPVYHDTGTGGWRTVAGDGSVFIWCEKERIPGFRDYITPHGDGYFPLPSLWIERPLRGDIPAPAPAGAWGSGQADAVHLLTHCAVIPRHVLARLQALHSCYLAPGEPWRLERGGTQAGWKTVWISGAYDKHKLTGLILCQRPPAARHQIKTTRRLRDRWAAHKRAVAAPAA